MKAMVLDGSFAAFDDQAVISRTRDLLRSRGEGDQILRRKLRSVLRRETPKLVAASERIGPRESGDQQCCRKQRQQRLALDSRARDTGPDFVLLHSS
jgi:hypothetical protein